VPGSVFEQDQGYEGGQARRDPPMKNRVGERKYGRRPLNAWITMISVFRERSQDLDRGFSDSLPVNDGSTGQRPG
jgi:hypothetical protein